MAVTLKDIAAATGLSKPTVARLLRDPNAPFRAQTRERVLAAARELGYRPNAAAKAINTGRFGHVVLLLGTDPGRSYLPAGLVEHAEDVLASRNMSLVIARLPDEQLTAQGFVPRVLRENMADGMIINYTHRIPDPMLARIREQAAPAIWINTKLPADCVHPDDIRGAQQATEHLIGLGHRRITFLHLDDYGGGEVHYSWADRRDGYMAAMQMAGLTPVVVQRHCPVPDQPAVVRSLLQQSDRPTAILSATDGGAVHAIYEAMLLGLHVPQDLSVFAIATRWRLSAAGKYVKSLLVPGAELGAAAVAALLDKINAPDTALPVRLVPLAPMDGDTCAPPARL